MHCGTCTVHRMATMKRPVVYLSDEEWELAKTLATEYGVTISEVVRILLTGKVAQAEFEHALVNVQSVLDTSTDELAKMSDGLRSFGAPRPAPKPGQR